jgi:hypothetical protein
MVLPPLALFPTLVLAPGPAAWIPWSVLLLVALFPWTRRIPSTRHPLPVARAPVWILSPPPHVMWFAHILVCGFHPHPPLVGISLVPPCGPHVLLWVLHPVLLGAPTRGGDMVVKFKQQALNSSGGSTIPHSIILPLDSTFFSLEKITMGQFSPLFLTL